MIDIHYGSVASLLHLDGANGGTTFTDETGKTVTLSGTVTTTTATYKYGTASGDFAGGNSDRLSVDAHDDFNFGAGNFTIECWFKENNVTKQYMTLIEKDSGTFPVGSWSLYINHASNTAGDIAFALRDYAAAPPILISTSGAFDDNAWHHVAVTRNGNQFQLWVDGVLKALTASTVTITDLSTAIYYGNSRYATRGWDGEIDDIRITKGVARYTTAFTVPASAFGDDMPTGSEVGETGAQGLMGPSIFGPPGEDGFGSVASVVLPLAPPRYDVNDQRQVRQLIERGFAG